MFYTFSIFSTLSQFSTHFLNFSPLSQYFVHFLNFQHTFSFFSSLYVLQIRLCPINNYAISYFLFQQNNFMHSYVKSLISSIQSIPGLVWKKMLIKGQGLMENRK